MRELSYRTYPHTTAAAIKQQIQSVQTAFGTQQKEQEPEAGTGAGTLLEHTATARAGPVKQEFLVFKYIHLRKFYSPANT